MTHFILRKQQAKLFWTTVSTIFLQGACILRQLPVTQKYADAVLYLSHLCIVRYSAQPFIFFISSRRRKEFLPLQHRAHVYSALIQHRYFRSLNTGLQYVCAFSCTFLLLYGNLSACCPLARIKTAAFCLSRLTSVQNLRFFRPSVKCRES